MYLPEFNFHQPVSVTDALALLDNGKNSVAMAGGTDLLVEMKKGLRRHSEVISLNRIAELKIITEDGMFVYVGACAKHNEILASPIVNKFIPVLAAAVSKIGTEQVRNTGTIGGNICTAASCSDTAPVLLALDASVEILNSTGMRSLPLSEFFIFNKKTVLKAGDLISRIVVRKPDSGTGAVYEKFGLREAGSISVVSVAVSVRIKQARIEETCIVIGAVAPTPRISKTATEVIRGKKVDDLLNNESLLEEAGKAAVMDSVPIDDIRGGAQYRRNVLNVLTKRAILGAVKAAKLNI